MHGCANDPGMATGHSLTPRPCLRAGFRLVAVYGPVRADLNVQSPISTDSDAILIVQEPTYLANDPGCLQAAE